MYEWYNLFNRVFFCNDSVFNNNCNDGQVNTMRRQQTLLLFFKVPKTGEQADNADECAAAGGGSEKVKKCGFDRPTATSTMQHHLSVQLNYFLV